MRLRALAGLFIVLTLLPACGMTAYRPFSSHRSSTPLIEAEYEECQRRSRAQAEYMSPAFGFPAAVPGCWAKMVYRHYRQHEILALPDLQPVAVHLFIDTRGVDPYVMGETWAKRQPIRTDEPVAVTVTRAFAEGLSARGYPVVDRRGSPFEPGESETSARVAVSGAIRQFWSSFGAEKLHCTVLLQAYDVASGRQLWEKSYSHAARSWEDALFETVKKAVHDPELIQQLGRR